MPHISIEKFPTFFGNTSKDVNQHLLKLKITCHVFNISKDNFTCQIFSQTLHGNTREWFFSLFLGTITSWDVLETSSVENLIPRIHPYSLFGVFNVVSYPPSPFFLFS
jgi:hypothetical protein